MATLTATASRAIGPFLAAANILTAADVIPYDASKRQLLVMYNGTAGSLTAVIDGDGGTTVIKPGIGSVSVASGLSITLAAGETRAVILQSVSDYCQGTVAITGGTGIRAFLLEL